MDDDLTRCLAVGGEAFGDLLQAGECLDDLRRQPRRPHFEVVAAVSGLYPEVERLFDLARDPFQVAVLRARFPHLWGLDGDGTAEDGGETVAGAVHIVR